MIILGINAYHADSSACIIKDGFLISAAEEERFTRIKHWSGFPRESINYCLREAGINIKDINCVSVNHSNFANYYRRLRYITLSKLSPMLIAHRLKRKISRNSFRDDLKDLGYDGKIEYIEHHLAHLSSAFHVSPFQSAAILSVDGFGDFASTVCASGESEKINVISKVYFPHSLGIFYQAITQWLGFTNYGDEYKVMGLSSYGKPKYSERVGKLIICLENGTFKLNLNYFSHINTKNNQVSESGEPIYENLYSDKLIELLGIPRNKNEEITQYHMDIAASAQKIYELAFFHILDALHEKTRETNLCLAGGCAMNSVANGKIQANTKFKNIYVQSAAGDAGGAIGAAFSTWHKRNTSRNYIMNSSYWGPGFSDTEIGQVIDAHNDLLNRGSINVRKAYSDQALFDQVVDKIIGGGVVGWFQGRMEWGPRALGNRSIICDPRRGDVQQILNLKIKRRESFRPFAPSILREFVSDWFESDGEVPFMMQVFKIKQEKQHEIPAVTHIDGSGRLQTVTRDVNEKYYGLIESFYLKTGIPILLNTSFNENEPIVCTPKEALNCFLRTNMDMLVLGNYVLSRV